MSGLLAAQLLALGVASGFLAGLLGIGGGMLMVPFLTAMLVAQGVANALAVKMAIATSMACIVATAISSTRAHHARGAVRWDVVRGMAPGVLVGGLLSGSALFGLLKGQTLAGVFALFVGFSAWQMWRGRQPHAGRALPGPLGLAGAGATVGLLSGLVGAGGGFLAVPFMVWCNVAVHGAVATSAAIGVPVALANTLGIDTIAEGVETEAQKQALIDLGCSLGQGYLLGRPAAQIGALPAAPPYPNWD